MGSARSPRSCCVALAICMFPINPQGRRTSVVGRLRTEARLPRAWDTSCSISGRPTIPWASRSWKMAKQWELQAPFGWLGWENLPKQSKYFKYINSTGAGMGCLVASRHRIRGLLFFSVLQGCYFVPGPKPYIGCPFGADPKFILEHLCTPHPNCCLKLEKLSLSGPRLGLRIEHVEKELW